MYSDVAPADDGPEYFPADPTGGQLWYLTATVGENDPGIYVYDLDLRPGRHSSTTRLRPAEPRRKRQ